MEEAEKIQRQNENYAKLKEEVPKLQKRYRDLDQTVEELKAERVQLKAKVAKREARERNLHVFVVSTRTRMSGERIGHGFIGFSLEGLTIKGLEVGIP
jgi:chromosome segregation ATPase